MTDELERCVRQIADDIVERLFVNGVGERAKRLVLWNDSAKQDLGGWCERAVRDQVIAAIEEAALARGAK